MIAPPASHLRYEFFEITKARRASKASTDDIGRRDHTIRESIVEQNGLHYTMFKIEQRVLNAATYPLGRFRG